MDALRRTLARRNMDGPDRVGLRAEEKPTEEAPGNRTPPPGSGFALSIPLQDSWKKAVGEINAICIATKTSPARGSLEGTYSGTADVPDGQLAINVGGEVGDNVSGAIVGGTGKYEGATGTFTSKSSGEGSEDTFNITLP